MKIKVINPNGKKPQFSLFFVRKLLTFKASQKIIMRERERAFL
jgi:hypothetical protein